MQLIKRPFVFEILLCAFLILLFRISYFFESLIYFIAGITGRNAFTDIMGLITQVLVFVIAIATGLKIQKRTLVSVCFFKTASAGVWGALVLCSVGFVLFHYYFTILFFSFLEGWNTNFGTSEGNLLINTINIALVPAVAEELLFKGLIFYSLKKRRSWITAVIVSSLLFAACHLQIIRFIPLFMFSCFSFWVYLRTGSIILPMFIHFVNNLFTLVLISEPFAELATFYSALVLFTIGGYMLYKVSKNTQ